MPRAIKSFLNGKKEKTILNDLNFKYWFLREVSKLLRILLARSVLVAALRNIKLITKARMREYATLLFGRLNDREFQIFINRSAHTGFRRDFSATPQRSRVWTHPFLPKEKLISNKDVMTYPGALLYCKDFSTQKATLAQLALSRGQSLKTDNTSWFIHTCNIGIKFFDFSFLQKRFYCKYRY